ncbi:MAG TPA: contractile injection system tape measure protein [Longimicrobium sp.]|nr:contractile injection system tape measure protein [Longimicrobium sp.]
MARAPHRIRRQVWRVRAPSSADAFALRGELRAAWEGALLPALEAAFDQAAPGDRVVRIPRLELRLRLGAANALAEELPRLVREAAAVELAVARRGGIPSVGDTAGDGSTSPAEDARATLLHYLRTGALPWSAAGGSADKVADALQAAVREAGVRLVNAIASAPEPRAFTFRLLQLVDDADVPAWIAALPPRVPALWRRVLLRLLVPAAAPPPDSIRRDDAPPIDDAPPPAPRHTRLTLAAALLVEAVTTTVDDTPHAIAIAASKAKGGGPGGAAASLLASLPEMAPARRDASRPERTAATRDAKARAVDDRAEEVDRRGARGGSDDGAKAIQRAAGGGWNAAEVESSGSASADRKGEEAGEAFGTSVANAGLILLHPFIAMLLERTGLRERDAIPEHALPHAAALLHYLATGRDDVQEWELGLVKVLLAQAPDAALPVADGLLRAEDREECDNVLHSAIAHWTVLRNSSPSLLRESFLRRGGLLHRGGEGWLLRVEPGSYDVLLAQLPWGISFVTLPWMPHPIHIEWTTTP